MPLVLSTSDDTDATDCSATPRHRGASDAQVAKTPTSALLSKRPGHNVNRRRKISVSFAAGTKPSPHPRAASPVSPESPSSPLVLASPAPPASPDGSPTGPGGRPTNCMLANIKCVARVVPPASPDSSPDHPIIGSDERLVGVIMRSTSCAPSCDNSPSDSEDDSSPKPSPQLRRMAMLREARATRAGLRF